MPRPVGKVLLVDDSLPKRLLIRSAIRTLDCEVIEAENGEQALDAVRRHDFAVILLDVQMPGMDGFEVAERMAEEWVRGHKAPIIFCTGTAFDDASRLRGYNAGAVDYLQEPADGILLLSKVRVFLELHQSREELRRLLAEKVLLEEKARHEAHHDGLTDLPNRRLFLDRLHHTLKRAQRYKQSFAVLYLDVDDFKQVNDVHGHMVGDELLVEFARRMRGAVRQSDTVARFGGDEFAVILDLPHGADDAIHKAERLAVLLSAPYTIRTPNSDREYRLLAGASIGVSVYPDNGVDARSLLHAADEALYAAKRGGKSLCVRAPVSA